jgi:hypothetical protein
MVNLLRCKGDIKLFFQYSPEFADNGKPSAWYIFHRIAGSGIFGGKESHEQNGT